MKKFIQAARTVLRICKNETKEHKQYNRETVQDLLEGDSEYCNRTRHYLQLNKHDQGFGQIERWIQRDNHQKK